MKKSIAIFLMCLLTIFSGCTLVPTDFMPKPVWYWSDDAKQHRALVAREKAEADANKQLQKNQIPDKSKTP